MTTAKRIVKITADFLSIKEVAALRRVTRQTVRNWLKNGLAHQEDRFGRVFVRRSDAENYAPAEVGWPKGVRRERKFSAPVLARADRLIAQGRTLKETAETLGVSESGLWQARKRARLEASV